MALVVPAVATSFATKGGNKSWASFATVGVAELGIAADALDVSAVCEAFDADGGSGGCSANDDPSGAALSVCFASCGSVGCSGIDCCCVGSAMVARFGAFVEAVASGLGKVETFGNATSYRVKAVIVHKITGTAMITATRIRIRRNTPK
jgi:hypothetical protein